MFEIIFDFVFTPFIDLFAWAIGRVISFAITCTICFTIFFGSFSMIYTYVNLEKLYRRLKKINFLRYVDEFFAVIHGDYYIDENGKRVEFDD